MSAESRFGSRVPVRSLSCSLIDFIFVLLGDRWLRDPIVRNSEIVMKGQETSWRSTHFFAVRAGLLHYRRNAGPCRSLSRATIGSGFAVPKYGKTVPFYGILM